MIDMRDLVLLITEGPLSAWQAARFGIPFFLSRQMDVACFNVRPLLGTGVAEGSDIGGISYLADVKSLSLLLDRASHVYVFSQYDLAEPSFARLAVVLKQRGISWCLVRNGAIPAALPPRTLSEGVSFILFQVRRQLRRLGLIRLMAAGLSRIISHGARGTFFPPRYVLLEGLKSAHPSDAGAIVILGHSRDMEIVIAQGVKAADPPENICVFMDQNEPRHTDWALHGITKRDLPEERWYVAALLQSFELIEAVTGLQVVVLPHPRFKYPQGYFGRFEVRGGDTMLAVAKARLVLSHYSTALGLAVIFDKPAVLLNAEVFKTRMGGRIDRQILAFAEALGAKLLSMDAPVAEALQGWWEIDRVKYAAYRADYVEYPGSPHESMWKIALDVMESHETAWGSADE